MKHVFSDPIAGKLLRDISRADVLDFRAKLVQSGELSGGSCNQIVGLLKIIFKEAVFRQDLIRDPTVGIGNIKENRKKAGTFSESELTLLFPVEGLGPWADALTFCCFFLDALTGMRAGEILALKWKFVDLQDSAIRLEEAWKDTYVIGPPKWDQKRVIPLPLFVCERLEQYKRERGDVSQDDLVFSYPDGRRLGNTWWIKRFHNALTKLSIDYKSRNLSPKSFRHTLNTLLLANGQSPEKVQATFGWRNQSTQEIYTHFGIDHLRDQSDLLQNIFRKKPIKKTPKKSRLVAEQL